MRRRSLRRLLLQRQIQEHNGRHGFDDNRGAKGKAHVVAAGNAGGGDAGRGFEGDTENDGVAVRDTAIDAAGVVCQRGLGLMAMAAVVAFAVAAMVAVVAFFGVIVLAVTLVPLLMAFAVAAVVLPFLIMMAAVMPAAMASMLLREGVVMLRTLHPGGGETVAEFDATDTRDGENRMREAGFDTVPERLAQSDGNAFDPAFDHAAEGIAFGLGRRTGSRPFGRVGPSADFAKTGIDASKMQQLFRHDTGGNDRNRHPATECSAAARVIEATELDLGRIVGMARTRSRHALIIL